MKQSELDMPLLGDGKKTNYLLEQKPSTEHEFQQSNILQEQQAKPKFQSILPQTASTKNLFAQTDKPSEQQQQGNQNISPQKQQTTSVQQIRNLAEKRFVYLDGTVFPEIEEGNNNLVKNYRYTANSFFPKVMYNYFKHFQNLLILVVVLVQLFPDFTVSFYYAILIPFGLICFLFFYKESTDDHFRREQNGFINNQSYKILNMSGETTVRCQDIKVGDLLLLGANERIPADVVLLHTSTQQNGQVFVNCEQIDGKSDVQIRRCIKYTHNYAAHNTLLTLKACVQIDPPTRLINSFQGIFKHEVGGGEGYVENINIYNTVWANSSLTNGSAIALVVYAGNHTKSQMNWDQLHYKQPKIDQEMNKLTYIYFTFFVILAFSVTVFTGFDSTWGNQFVRNLLMYCTVLPISVRFCLTLSKILLTNKVQGDLHLKNIKVNNRNNPEDLGRFQFMLLDKTGTITKNQMIFKKIALLDQEFGEENLQDIKDIIIEECKKQGACSDLNDKNTNKKYRTPEALLRDTLTVISVCNNVTPISQGAEVRYETSSQDEISLVQLAEKSGLRLLRKTYNTVEIENAVRDKETYQIVQEFPFTSELRKMGVLAKCVQTGKYIYFFKGADDVVRKILPERQMPYVMELSESLGNQGLRTMVYGLRYLSHTEFKEWYGKYGQPLKTSSARDQVLLASQAELESENIQFLAISGLEEQIQEETRETIQVIRESGIKLWMVTGDSMAISKQISILSGIKNQNLTYETFQMIQDEYTISVRLTSLDKKLSLNNKIVLVIDNVSYKTAIRFKENYFFDLLFVCTSVILTNFTPAQKSSLTVAVKKHSKGEDYVVAVGNGANDVQMFQKADYSICVSGEPKLSKQQQATIGCDLRIHQFKDIQRLLQYHGLNVYKRSTVMLAYLVQRGLILATIQAVFSVIYQVQIQIFNPIIMMCMSTVFCVCPIMCIISHYDFEKSNTKYHRDIYSYLQKSRELSTKNFMIWAFRAIYQAVCTMVLGIYMFPDHFDQQNVTFFVFVAIELLNFWGEISFSFGSLILQLFQLLMYVGVLFIDHGHFEVMQKLIMDKDYMGRIGIIVACTYLPLQILKMMINSRYPTEYQKTLKKIKAESKEQIKQENQQEQFQIELREYNQKMEKQWLDEQQKINPDIENPDYVPPPKPVVISKKKKKQQQQQNKKDEKKEEKKGGEKKVEEKKKN